MAEGGFSPDSLTATEGEFSPGSLMITEIMYRAVIHSKQNHDEANIFFSGLVA